VKVVIIDYGMSNLGSVKRAFEECSADVIISDNPDDLLQAERIVLPGVGAFYDGMANLNAGGWPEKLKMALTNPNVQLLGICLGMQLLASMGYEGGETHGLGLIPGEVKRFNPDGSGDRIPHIGWNEVHFEKSHKLTNGLKSGTDFYFVHSYFFNVTHPSYAIASTPYCGGFTSIISLGNVMGTQFHPEKSSRPGFQIIRNFLTR
jgi:glutamine amidotransferase